ALLLVALAAVESDAVDMLADAHEPEAQPGLAAIALGLQPDQRPADAPAQPGGGAGIDQGAPDEIAGNREALAIHVEGHARRQEPEHADEAAEQERRLQQPDAELGRQLRQMAGVLMQALIGGEPDLGGAGRAEARREGK